MVGLPDYGVAFCVAPWPDGGWIAGVQVTSRDWVQEQIDDTESYGQSLDPAMLNVPNTDDEFPQWDIIDGFKDGITAYGDDAADAIDHLWAKVHGDEYLRRHQRSA